MFPQTQRKRKVNLSSTDSNGKRKRHHNIGMIVEDTLLPLRILSCQQGNPTIYGTKTLRFTFQHLDSKEKFNSTVFEESAPDYIDVKILDAVLPPEVEYSLEDLVNKGLFAKLKFRTKNDKTYINIVQVAPLNEKYKNQLADLLREEGQQDLDHAVKTLENQMKDINHESESLEGELDELDEIDIDIDEDEINMD